jgi:hypothetical protein
VVVEARLVKLGRDVGSIEVRLIRASSGELVATGEGAGRVAPRTVAAAAVVTDSEGEAGWCQPKSYGFGFSCT